MSVYPSVLDQSLSLNLLYHMYFKFSSFCLCHTSLQSFPLVLCQPAKISLFPSPEQPTRHLSRLAGSCSLLSFFPWWESVRKSMWIPSEAAMGRPDHLKVPPLLMNCSFTGWRVSFGVPVCLLGPRVWLELEGQMTWFQFWALLVMWSWVSHLPDRSCFTQRWWPVHLPHGAMVKTKWGNSEYSTAA